MVFRLPTHLDSFIPPPSAQTQIGAAARPWRGTLTVRGMRASDLGGSQEIRVTAVETDGDSDVRRWPQQFFAQLAHGRPILREVRAWIQQHSPPISTFMPDRLHDPDTNVVNMTNFRSLSRLLFEHQIVAIANWGNDSFPGGGIIIVPAEHSSALLVAALFFSQFPEIITTRLTLSPSPPSAHSHPTQHHSPSSVSPYHPSSSGSASSYHQPLSATPLSQSQSQPQYGYASPTMHSPTALRRAHGPGHHSGSLSPTAVEQPISRARQAQAQEQFRATMPMPMPVSMPMPREPSMHAWPPPRDEANDATQYSPYSSHGHGHGHRYPSQPPPRSN